MAVVSFPISSRSAHTGRAAARHAHRFWIVESLAGGGRREAFPLPRNVGGKGAFVGTPCYLAPEIEAIHQGGADAPRSYGVAPVDAWSLGRRQRHVW